jgi:hypothetical protein
MVLGSEKSKPRLCRHTIRGLLHVNEKIEPQCKMIFKEEESIFYEISELRARHVYLLASKSKLRTTGPLIFNLTVQQRLLVITNTVYFNSGAK